MQRILKHLALALAEVLLICNTVLSGTFEGMRPGCYAKLGFAGYETRF